MSIETSNASNTSSPSSTSSKRIFSALAAGVVYGLLVRISFEAKALHSFLQIVSTAFLIVAPFCIGAISVLVAAERKRITIGRQITIAIGAMTIFLAAMFITLLEGLICIVLVAPVFFIASMVGGLLAGLLNNHFRVGRSTLSCIALLPLLLGPLEARLPPTTSEQTVSTEIEIVATPGEVFDQLAAVQDIRSEELGFSFVHMIGLPKPIEANMDGAGVGSVRTSKWQKDVQFQEVITRWDRGHALHYRFNIPPGSIPRDALDRHVELGGEYFTVLDGGYDLRATGRGTTVLTLSTRFLNKSQLKAYGDVWGHWVLDDFHGAILGLMKTRAEKAHLAAAALRS